MPAQTFAQISQQIKSAKLAPVYLLWGEEDYYIDKLTAQFEQTLDDMQKEFDFSVFYGQDLKSKEPGLKGVIANCKRFPVMAPFQMIIVKEAQVIDRWDSVEDYLQKPIPTTCLVLCHKHKKIDKRKAVFKLIDKVGMSFESAPLKDKDFAPWISNHIAENGYKITAQALGLLCESIGSNLNQIANELQKIFVNLPQGSEINEDHIHDHIGIDKEYNVFTLEKALGARNPVQTKKICLYMAGNPKNAPLPLIMIQLYRFFSKIIQIHDLARRGTPRSEWSAALGVPPFFLAQYEGGARAYSYKETAFILHLLKEYDLKSKGVESTLEPADLLDELCFRILHAC